jgi:hypothetical protein
MEINEQNSITNTIYKFARDNLKSFVIKSLQTLNPNSKFIDNWHLDLIMNYLKAALKTLLNA